MWFYFLLYVSFSLLSAKAELNGDCEVEGVSANQWRFSFINVPVGDNEKTLFKEFNMANVTNVLLIGDEFSKYVEIEVKDENKVLFIRPSGEFEQYEKNEKSVPNPTLRFKLNFECQTGNGNLDFEQPIEDYNTFEPLFEKPEYNVMLPMPLPSDFDITLLLEEEIIAYDYDISNTRVNFFIESSTDFKILESKIIDDKNKRHKAVIATTKPLKLIEDTSINIISQDIGSPIKTSKTTLNVHVDVETSFPSNPNFKHPYYIAHYNSDDAVHTIHFDQLITLNAGNTGITPTLSGDLGDHFAIEFGDNDDIVVTLKNNLPDDVLNEDPIVLLTINAHLDRAEEPGRTVIVVYLPRTAILPPTTAGSTTITDCPPCSTPETSRTTDCPTLSTTTPTTAGSTTETDCPIPTECPQCPTPQTSTSTECPTLSTTTPTSSIKFEKDNYYYEVPPRHQGFLDFITATANPEEDINYLLEDVNGESNIIHNFEIGVSDGRLEVVNQLNVGNSYKFLVKCEGVSSAASSSTSVEIFVKNPTEIESENLLLIQKVVEQQRAQIELPCEENKICDYVIVSQEPQTSPKLFNYNNGFLDVTAINRNMDEIKDMPSPQFTLKLQLRSFENKLSESPLRNSSLGRTNFEKSILRGDSKEWVYLPTIIPNVRNQLIMSIVIEDINDHPPVFEVGNDGVLVVGYPESKLLGQIAPQYLAKVYASDEDAGLNALIKYTTNSNNYVVNPETGVIYPGKTAFKDGSDETFTVTASDRQGEAGSLSDNLEVQVKLLKSENVIILTMSNVMLEDLNATLEELSIKSKLALKYLTASIIPSGDDRGLDKNQTRQATDYTTKITLYGMNPENAPLTTSELKKALEAVEPGRFTLEDVPVCDVFPADEEIDITAYIVAVSVLASLLFIFMIGGALFYYFKIYKVSKMEPYENMDKQEKNQDFVLDLPNEDDEVLGEKEVQPKNSKMESYENMDKQEKNQDFVFDSPNENDEELEEKIVQPKNTDLIGFENILDNPELDKKSVDENDEVNESVGMESILDDSEIRDQKSVHFKETVLKYNIPVEENEDEENQDVRL